MAISNTEAIHGVNWSVFKNLVTPSTAECAGQEILNAIEANSPKICFDHVQPKNKYTGYVISGWDAVSDEVAAADNFPFSQLFVVRKSLKWFKPTDLLADKEGGHFDEGFVNVTQPGGLVPEHFDNEPWSLVFVSLMGRAIARIRHPSQSSFTEIELSPGDVLRIVNPIDKNERPRHSLETISSTIRVSYGEYTDPAPDT